jgi:hypothetical protein
LIYFLGLSSSIGIYAFELLERNGSGRQNRKKKKEEESGIRKGRGKGQWKKEGGIK